MAVCDRRRRRQLPGGLGLGPSNNRMDERIDDDREVPKTERQLAVRGAKVTFCEVLILK